MGLHSNTTELLSVLFVPEYLYRVMKFNKCTIPEEVRIGVYGSTLAKRIQVYKNPVVLV